MSPAASSISQHHINGVYTVVGAIGSALTTQAIDHVISQKDSSSNIELGSQSGQIQTHQANEGKAGGSFQPGHYIQDRAQSLKTQRTPPTPSISSHTHQENIQPQHLTSPVTSTSPLALPFGTALPAISAVLPVNAVLPVVNPVKLNDPSLVFPSNNNGEIIHELVSDFAPNLDVIHQAEKENECTDIDFDTKEHGETTTVIRDAVRDQMVIDIVKELTQKINHIKLEINDHKVYVMEQLEDLEKKMSSFKNIIQQEFSSDVDQQNNIKQTE